MTDEERDHILKTAAEHVFVIISPLIITSVAWIVIACIALFRKSSVNPGAPS
jgi:hypothetical protein